jgi:hypothetical protein
MCRQLSILCVMLLASLPVRAEAMQQTLEGLRAERARLVAAESVLVARWRAHKVLLDSARVALAVTQKIEDPTDTARVGPFVIVGLSSQLKRAVPSFEQAWADFRPLVGNAEARLQGRILLFVPYDLYPSAGWLTPADSIAARYLTMQRDPHDDLDRRSGYLAIGSELVKLMPRKLQLWMNGEWGYPESAEAVYHNLATSGADAARRCFRNDIAACVNALGLLPNEDWRGWYAPAQLRNLVHSRNLAAAPNWYECVKGSDSACVRFYEIRSETPPGPLWASARYSLLWQVLESAGPGSFEKLIEDPAIDAPHALERLAGRALPDVVKEWRDELQTGRPNMRAEAGKVALLALAWSVIFTFLASRSTRWRIG